jgi:hypothetical protein
MNKTFGGLGLLSALFWGIGIVLQFVNTDTASGVYKTGDTLITAGFVGLAIFVVGILVSGLAGRGVFTAIALSVWAFGHLGIAIGGVVQNATGNADNAFYPIGGLCLLLGGLASAVVIARAGVLTGWRRWTPLAWFLTYVGVFATLFDSDTDPSPVLLVPFLLWLAAVAATSVAVATSPATTAQPVGATA